MNKQNFRDAHKKFQDNDGIRFVCIQGFTGEDGNNYSKGEIIYLVAEFGAMVEVENDTMPVPWDMKRRDFQKYFRMG